MSQSKPYILICLLFVLLALNASNGQGVDVPDYLERIIVTKADKINSKKARKDKSLLLIKTGLQTKKSDLKRSGIEIVRWLAPGFYVVEINSEEEIYYEFIDGQWFINDLWKLEKNLFDLKASIHSTWTVKSSSPEITLHALNGVKRLKFISIDRNLFYIRANLSDMIEKVASRPEVTYIGMEAQQPATEARVIDMNLNPNTINKIHHFLPDLNGTDMVVSIQEPSYDKEDVDLTGRDIPSDLTSEVVDRHSTEMATIVAGAGNSFVTGRGVAWNVSLTSSDFSDIFPDEDQSYRGLGAWVQNHSYGTIAEGFYGAFAESYDQSANSVPELLHVFSAGNQGAAVGPPGNYEGVEGFSNVTGNFKHAKNLLVVGSVDTVGNVLDFSSRGPAYDGRVKPELVAYASVGTSNSAAIVSGVAVLMQQAFLEENGAIPPSALVKAVLINSAEDVANPRVDFLSGYGNVDGYRSVENILANRFLSGSISDGQEQTFNLTVPANAENLKITVVWNDPVAAVNSAQALVNDLDMVVTSQGGQEFLPWVLRSVPDATGLIFPATRGEDHLNNIEQVTVDEPEAGNFTITIKGFDVPEGVQDFYIAYQWDESDQFSWDYPTGSDNMPFNGESGSYFRWKSTLADQTGRLEYSIDNGSSWVVINESVDLSKGFQRWEVPRDITSRAIARMQVDDETYESEQFTISRPQRLGIGFNCGDSVLLQWNRIEGVDQYQVFTFNENSLETLRTTADTAVVVNASEIPSNLVSLLPVFDDQSTLLRSELIDYTFQGVQCYVSFFFPEVVTDEGLYFNLQLGTNYQVEEIIFERKEQDVFVPIGSIMVDQGDSTGYRFLDEDPIQGININRVKLRLANGQEIITEESQIFFITEIPFVVFPNPVLRSDGLNVFSKEFGPDEEVTFILYDRTGKIVMERRILSDRENVTFEKVKRGMYIYNILAPGVNFRGRVMVE